MPIKNLSEVRRLPRVGKIHLGVKKISPRTQREYPVATPYFVVPPEVEKIYGKEPRKLDVIIPIEDDEIWASQYYKQYSNVRGLVCKGDGVTCRRMIDTEKETTDVANRNTKTVKWEEGLECQGRDCPDYQSGACQEVMNLQVILPKVEGVGVWQIDTGSINSIRNINDCANLIRAVTGHISYIQLILSLEPTEVVNPDDGKKKVVYCMHLRTDKGFLELTQAANKPREQLFISMPSEDEAPMDKQVTLGNEDNIAAFEGLVEEETNELFGEAPAMVPSKTAQQVESKVVQSNPPSLFDNIRKHRPALKTDKNVTDWLTGPLRIDLERITSDPSKVWEEVRQLNNW